MGRFQNSETGVVVSVDDSKDERFTRGVSGWEPAADEGSKSTGRKASSSSKSEK